MWLYRPARPTSPVRSAQEMNIWTNDSTPSRGWPAARPSRWITESTPTVHGSAFVYHDGTSSARERLPRSDSADSQEPTYDPEHHARHPIIRQLFFFGSSEAAYSAAPSTTLPRCRRRTYPRATSALPPRERDSSCYATDVFDPFTGDINVTDAPPAPATSFPCNRIGPARWQPMLALHSRSRTSGSASASACKSITVALGAAEYSTQRFDVKDRTEPHRFPTIWTSSATGMTAA